MFLCNRTEALCFYVLVLKLCVSMTQLFKSCWGLVSIYRLNLCWCSNSFASSPSFFSFAYTTSPAAVVKLVVFFRSSKPPYNFWWSGVAEGHCAIRSGLCLLHLWRTCSVVWSSSPQGHVGEGTIFSFLCMCALSLLWPERSRAKTTLTAIISQSHLKSCRFNRWWFSRDI